MLPIRLAEGKQNDKLDVVRQLVLNITFAFSVSLAAGIPGCRWGKTGHHDSTYIFFKKNNFYFAYGQERLSTRVHNSLPLITPLKVEFFKGNSFLCILFKSFLTIY